MYDQFIVEPFQGLDFNQNYIGGSSALNFGGLGFRKKRSPHSAHDVLPLTSTNDVTGIKAKQLFRSRRAFQFNQKFAVNSNLLNCNVHGCFVPKFALVPQLQYNQQQFVTPQLFGASTLQALQVKNILQWSSKIHSDFGVFRFGLVVKTVKFSNDVWNQTIWFKFQTFGRPWTAQT